VLFSFLLKENPQEEKKRGLKKVEQNTKDDLDQHKERETTLKQKKRSSSTLRKRSEMKEEKKGEGYLYYQFLFE